MRLLVFNSGSSSLKFQLFNIDGKALLRVLRGVVRALGEQSTCEWVYGNRQERRQIAVGDHGTATHHVLKLLHDGITPGVSLLTDVAAIGHRLVHGGDAFVVPTLIDDRSLASLDALSTLAPLHNPPALAVMRACQERLVDIPMVAVFDTAFFRDLPDSVRAYALPAEWTKPPRVIRRYGFHGLAHRYMAQRCSAIGGVDATTGRLITFQLGHGCSAAAIRGGRPLETSMGFTPLEGLIMATRPGDLDAGAMLYLLEDRRVTLDDLNEGLNHRAGLLGLSGISADMQILLAMEAQGHAGASLAINAFCHRARKYLGAYLAALGGVDAIIFGGGIGENASAIRARICAGMEWCGLTLDAAANAAAIGAEGRISMPDSRVAAYVIPVDEESLVAQDTLDYLRTE